MIDEDALFEQMVQEEMARLRSQMSDSYPSKSSSPPRISAVPMSADPVKLPPSAYPPSSSLSLDVSRSSYSKFEPAISLGPNRILSSNPHAVDPYTVSTRSTRGPLLAGNMDADSIKAAVMNGESFGRFRVKSPEQKDRLSQLQRNQQEYAHQLQLQIEEKKLAKIEAERKQKYLEAEAERKWKLEMNSRKGGNLNFEANSSFTRSRSPAHEQNTFDNRPVGPSVSAAVSPSRMGPNGTQLPFSRDNVPLPRTAARLLEIRSLAADIRENDHGDIYRSSTEFQPEVPKRAVSPFNGVNSSAINYADVVNAPNTRSHDIPYHSMDDDATYAQDKYVNSSINGRGGLGSDLYRDERAVSFSGSHSIPSSSVLRGSVQNENVGYGGKSAINLPGPIMKGNHSHLMNLSSLSQGLANGDHNPFINVGFNNNHSQFHSHLNPLSTEAFTQQSVAKINAAVAGKNYFASYDGGVGGISNGFGGVNSMLPPLHPPQNSLRGDNSLNVSATQNANLAQLQELMLTLLNQLSTNDAQNINNSNNGGSHSTSLPQPFNGPASVSPFLSYNNPPPSHQLNQFEKNPSHPPQTQLSYYGGAPTASDIYNTDNNARSVTKSAPSVDLGTNRYSLSGVPPAVDYMTVSTNPPSATSLRRAAAMQHSNHLPGGPNNDDLSLKWVGKHRPMTQGSNRLFSGISGTLGENNQVLSTPQQAGRGRNAEPVILENAVDLKTSAVEDRDGPTQLDRKGSDDSEVNLKTLEAQIKDAISGESINIFSKHQYEPSSHLTTDNSNINIPNLKLESSVDQSTFFARERSLTKDSLDESNEFLSKPDLKDPSLKTNQVESVAADLNESTRVGELSMIFPSPLNNSLGLSPSEAEQKESLDERGGPDEHVNQRLDFNELDIVSPSSLDPLGLGLPTLDETLSRSLIVEPKEIPDLPEQAVLEESAVEENSFHNEVHDFVYRRNEEENESAKEVVPELAMDTAPAAEDQETGINFDNQDLGDDNNSTLQSVNSAAHLMVTDASFYNPSTNSRMNNTKQDIGSTLAIPELDEVECVDIDSEKFDLPESHPINEFDVESSERKVEKIEMKTQGDVEVTDLTNALGNSEIESAFRSIQADDSTPSSPGLVFEKDESTVLSGANSRTSSVPTNRLDSSGSNQEPQHDVRDEDIWGLPSEIVSKHKEFLMKFYLNENPKKANDEQVRKSWLVYGPSVWLKLEEKYGHERVSPYVFRPTSSQ